MEVDLEALVNPLLTGGLWPDIAPAGTRMPYATYSQVGGAVVNPINGADPGIKSARVQINVWATTRNTANTKMRAIEAALRPAPFSARPVGALVATINEITEARGAMQDFEVWWNT